MDQSRGKLLLLFCSPPIYIYRYANLGKQIFFVWLFYSTFFHREVFFFRVFLFYFYYHHHQHHRRRRRSRSRCIKYIYERHKTTQQKVSSQSVSYSRVVITWCCVPEFLFWNKKVLLEKEEQKYRELEFFGV